ncbi:MAG: DUF1538 domain-containing protein [Dehalococcoidales bacterium]|nr:DUF1538 domain-containing protein [Dehalococcoidales bacterium]
MSWGMFFDMLLSNAVNLSRGVLPIILLFLVLQIAYLKLPWKRVWFNIAGSFIALVGLILFMTGINLAFYPIGESIGEFIAGIRYQWVIVVIGAVLGFVAALSEPSIRIQADQVSKFTSNVIKSNLVVYTISVGVALADALGMLRIIYMIPLRFIVVPGYILALILLMVGDRQIVTIAFDSGGVATGPVPAVFLTAVAFGVSAVIYPEQTAGDSFGLVALIVMAPVLAMLSLGVIYRIGKNKKDRGGKKK